MFESLHGEQTRQRVDIGYSKLLAAPDPEFGLPSVPGGASYHPEDCNLNTLVCGVTRGAY